MLIVTRLLYFAIIILCIAAYVFFCVCLPLDIHFIVFLFVYSALWLQACQ